MDSFAKSFGWDLPLSIIVLILMLGCTNQNHILSNTHQPKAKTLADKVSRVVIAGSPHESAYLPFDWSIYEDPSRPEFWADGEDGIMPRPFLHLASDPTIENVKKLLLWKKLQWQVVEEVIRSLGGAAELELYSEVIGQDFIEFSADKDPLFKLASVNVNNKVNADDKGSIDWHKLRVVYIYRSTCQHCKQTIPFIKTLALLGAEIAPLQLDFGKEKPLHETSMPYTGDWKTYFPLSEGRPTPTFYFSYQNKPAFSHVGQLRLTSLTKHLTQNFTKHLTKQLTTKSRGEHVN